MRTSYRNVNVVEFLLELNVRNVRDMGIEVQYSCPFPDHRFGDRHPSATMEKGTTRAHCFGCGWSGNAVTFLSELEGISPIKAAGFIHERFGYEFTEPETTLLDEVNANFRVKERKQQIIDYEEIDRRALDWNAVLDAYEANPDNPPVFAYMLERGFTPPVLDAFEIGWCPISQRFSIPVRNENGDLIGFKGRTPYVDVKPKYLVLGGDAYGFDSYDVSKVVFGLHDVMEMGRVGNPYDTIEQIIVTEGELNAISMQQKGFMNAVGISGKFLSDAQVQLLKRVADSAVLIFDEQEDALNAARKLELHMRVLVADEHDRDPADSTREELKELVDGARSSLFAHV